MTEQQKLDAYLAARRNDPKVAARRTRISAMLRDEGHDATQDGRDFIAALERTARIGGQS